MSAPRFLTLALATCIGATAYGSPRTDPTSGRAVFTGATAPSVTSIVLNPAALGVGNVGEFLVALTSVLDQISVDRSGDSTASASVVDVSPGADVGVIYRTPGGRFTLGIDGRSAPAEVFPGGEQALRYHSLGGHERHYIASFAASVKVVNQFYVGASLSHDNTLLHLKYARDTALAAGEPSVEDPTASEIFDVRTRSPWVSTKNLKINIGFVLALRHRELMIGLAYHAPPGLGIENTLDGDVDVTLPSRDGGGVLHGQSQVLVSFPASADAEVRARLPKLLELRVGGRWEDLSRFRAYDVRALKHNFAEYGVPEWTRRPRGFVDPFAFWGGVEQVDTGQPFRIGGRIGFETASVDTDKTSPLTIAPASFTLDAGVQWRPTNTSNLKFQLSYGLQIAPPVHADHSAFDPQLMRDCIASGYDYSTAACRAAREGYAIDSAQGTYTKIEHAVRLALSLDIP